MTHPAQTPIVGETLATADAVTAALRAWEFEARRANRLQARLDEIRAELAKPRAADRIKRLRALLDEG